MTSDKVGSAVALEYALGKKRVSIGELTPREFDDFLLTVLQNVDLRELRGFKPLKDLLSRRPGSFVCGQRQNPLETVEITASTRFQGVPPGDGQFELTSQVVSVTRGAINQIVTYRRYESGEETTDWKIADTWKDGKGVRKVEENILVIRRPGNHTLADDNLFAVWYDFFKVPHENRMTIGQIKVLPVTLPKFREFFGDLYPRIAQNLIWELANLSRTTLETLQNQAVRYLAQVTNLERLADAVME